MLAMTMVVGEGMRTVVMQNMILDLTGIDHRGVGGEGGVE
jgi:hypothetical protein